MCGDSGAPTARRPGCDHDGPAVSVAGSVDVVAGWE